jgi:hypothetical protein
MAETKGAQSMHIFLTLLAICAIPIASLAQQPPKSLNVHILDYCDPTTFNEAVGDGTCVRDTTSGFLTFNGFANEATTEKSVGAWRFTPPTKAIVKRDGTLEIDNLGGELHTFTEVKKFGGGFVDFLNQATGNLEPAPECAQVVNGQLVPQPASDDNLFIAPGAHASHKLDHDETFVHYQCCVHPWMRITIQTDRGKPDEHKLQQ